VDGYGPVVQPESLGANLNCGVQTWLEIMLVMNSLWWMVHNIIESHGKDLRGSCFLGDSLCQVALDDKLVAIGRDAPSFQILHGIYRLEQAILDLKRRDCNFEIVFFECMFTGHLLARSTRADKYLQVTSIVQYPPVATNSLLHLGFLPARL
jgi:hypothetical protein